MRAHIAAAFLILSAAAPAPAFAQRFSFEQSFDVSDRATLDVSTLRGKIDITIGDPGKIVVGGAATVRLGWNVPANAVELAQKVAKDPPIRRNGNTLELRPPADPAEQRAMTINYQVKVPRNTDVVTVSDSGATTISGVGGQVTVRTQSGAIEVKDLGGVTGITTGSGAVVVDGVKGALNVTTSSSGFNGRGLGRDVRVRTSSGAVTAALEGDGDVDVETGSSEIHVRGARGGVKTNTRSGRTVVQGLPARPWDLSSGSGAVEATVEGAPAFKVDASSGSGSVTVDGADVHGTVTKREVAGTIGHDGPLVRINSRSGSIAVSVKGR
jgi:hypothetical protein